MATIDFIISVCINAQKIPAFWRATVKQLQNNSRQLNMEDNGSTIAVNGQMLPPKYEINATNATSNAHLASDTTIQLNRQRPKLAKNIVRHFPRTLSAVHNEATTAETCHALNTMLTQGVLAPITHNSTPPMQRKATIRSSLFAKSQPRPTLGVLSRNNPDDLSLPRCETGTCGGHISTNSTVVSHHHTNTQHTLSNPPPSSTTYPTSHEGNSMMRGQAEGEMYTKSGGRADTTGASANDQRGLGVAATHSETPALTSITSTTSAHATSPATTSCTPLRASTPAVNALGTTHDPSPQPSCHSNTCPSVQLTSRHPIRPSDQPSTHLDSHPLAYQASHKPRVHQHDQPTMRPVEQPSRQRSMPFPTQQTTALSPTTTSRVNVQFMVPTAATTHAAYDPWWLQVLTLHADVHNSTPNATPGQPSTDLVKHPASSAATSINHRSLSNSTGTTSNHQLRNGTERLLLQDIDDIASPQTHYHHTDVPTRANTAIVTLHNYNGPHGYPMTHLSFAQCVPSPKTQPQHGQSPTPGGLGVATRPVHINSFARTLVTQVHQPAETSQQMQPPRLPQPLYINDPTSSQPATVIRRSILIQTKSLPNDNPLTRKARLVADTIAKSAPLVVNDATTHCQRATNTGVTAIAPNSAITFIASDPSHRHSIHYGGPAAVKAPYDTSEVTRHYEPSQRDTAPETHSTHQVDKQPSNPHVFTQSRKFSSSIDEQAMVHARHRAAEHDNPESPKLLPTLSPPAHHTPARPSKRPHFMLLRTTSTMTFVDNSRSPSRYNSPVDVCPLWTTTQRSITAQRCPTASATLIQAPQFVDTRNRSTTWLN
jgi:hypothetical protein